jgi:hypothetical protein
MISKVNLEECELSVQKIIEFLALKGSNIVIYSNGQPHYFFGAIDDFDDEVVSLSQNQDFVSYLAECRQRGKEGKNLSFAEVQQRLMDLESLER